MLKNTAVQKPSTTNPPTILAHKMMSKALMTNKNKPKDKIVTGNVNKIKMGFINTLSSYKTKATNKEVVKLATATPGKNSAMSSTNKAVVNKRISNCIR